MPAPPTPSTPAELAAWNQQLQQILADPKKVAAATRDLARRLRAEGMLVIPVCQDHYDSGNAELAAFASHMISDIAAKRSLPRKGHPAIGLAAFRTEDHPIWRAAKRANLIR